ncbi:MAG: hypothetical protein EP330_18920 [Deltaproteobacteria bacterium]|nr:MAG: hypothetical protein EP330_18920 [Deltaproteobacteria bacterium]
MSTLTLDEVTSRLSDAGEAVFTYDTDADPLVAGFDDALSEAAARGGGWLLFPPPLQGGAIARVFTEELKEQAEAQALDLECAETVDCGTVWAVHVEASLFPEWEDDEKELPEWVDDERDEDGEARVEPHVPAAVVRVDTHAQPSPVWTPNEVRYKRRLDPLLLAELAKKSGKSSAQTLRDLRATAGGDPTDAAYLLLGDDPTDLWDWAEIGTELYGQPKRNFIGPMVGAVRRCADQRAFQAFIGRTGLERLLFHAVAHRDWDMPQPITLRRLQGTLEVSFPVGRPSRLNTELQELLTRLHIDTAFPAETSRTTEAELCVLRARRPTVAPRSTPVRISTAARPQAAQVRSPTPPPRPVRVSPQRQPSAAPGRRSRAPVSPGPASPRPHPAVPPISSPPTRRPLDPAPRPSTEARPKPEPHRPGRSTETPGAAMSPNIQEEPLRPSSARMTREQRKQALTAWVQAQGGCSTKELEVGLGWTRSTVRAILEAVIDEGRVRRTDANPRSPTQRYVATAAG